MKLRRFYIEEYRVIKDLNIKFSSSQKQAFHFANPPSYTLDFFVGVNGSGKSTALRVLSDLMLRLEGSAQAPIPYNFELEYDLDEASQKRSIKISNIPDEEEEETEYTSPLKVWENGKEVSISDSLLPKQIIVYTTGAEDEWERIEAEAKSQLDHQYTNNYQIGREIIQNLTTEELSISELPGKPVKSLYSEDIHTIPNPIFQRIKSHQLDKVILCGLIEDCASSESLRLAKILEAIKIKNNGFVGFSLKFRKTHKESYIGDWKDIERLANIATRKLHLGTDYLLVFDLTKERKFTCEQILKNFVSGLNLFKKLAQLADINDDGQSVLREVNIFFERCSKANHPETELDNKPPLHLLNWFSDGERNFLARMCLFRIISATESLILLDEPEVHFNDLWKRQIVHFIDETLEGCNSHILITTHSSITITDVPKEDIIVFDRNGNYTDTAINPAIRTFAADPSDIMVHVFGAPHPAGESSVERIEQELKALSDYEPQQKQETLENLLNVVGQGYWSYRIRRELITIKKE